MAIPWGTIRADTLVLNGNAIDTSSIVAPANRVVSGKTRSGSNQPAFIVPNGGALSFVIDGTPTNLVLSINGAEVTVNTDITKSSLTAAPSSNNTCLVNDGTAADQFQTKLYSGDKSLTNITVDNMGSEITALIGKFAAFKIAGVTDEYLIAYVESSTLLTRAYRGFFFDSSLNPVKATGFSNNDVITLLKLGYIFVENDATTVDVTYNAPVYSFTSPGSPVTGDYWFDLANQVWKRYDGASFQIINRTFVGWFANDTSACIAARSADFYAKFEDTNQIALEQFSTEIIRMSRPFQYAVVMGQPISFGGTLESWNITTDLASSSEMFDATEQSDRMYYLYLKDTGETVISDIPPYYRNDLLGEYHPYNPWRAVGITYNNGSSDLVGVDSYSGVVKTTTIISKNSTQSIPNATETTVTWDIIEDDNVGLFRSSDSFIVFKRPGKYLISIALEFDTSATGVRRAHIYKNSFKIRQIAFATPSGANSTMVAGSTIINASVGDYVYFNAEHNAGGALNIGVSGSTFNHFCVTKIGEIN